MLAQLNHALLTDEEVALGASAWQLFPDDFPVWNTQSA
jgi:hypothetical protein